MAEFKKLNGRPKLKDGRRVKKLDIRFTQEEYDIILAIEKELGISKTELLRMRALNDSGKILLNSGELIRSIDRIGAEMGRAGNNINQLAKHANTMKLAGSLQPHVAVQFNTLLNDYISIQRLLETSLRKIIQLMGK
ncbi:plasmid mobilization relaxosome protein MobC [Mucilaginibacter angelicae]|uniref:Plasmid mobilization relaxosome protein MobC n=1 Tax=Mucilaginibacter angelicae TaxID=869718 RepID=A0ABV6L1L8_9SPHI